MKKFEVLQKCESCNGSGLYQGFAERNGIRVVCSNCKGTGSFKFVHLYEEAKPRRRIKGVNRVLLTNPGISVANSPDFGGMLYEDWVNLKNPKKFPVGTEMRNYTCPAWWYQAANYDKKPEWKECTSFGTFKECPHFKNKTKCWERFDKENDYV